MKADESKERSGQCFNMLMNKEHHSVETEERDPNQAMTRNISEEETEVLFEHCCRCIVYLFEWRNGGVFVL